MRKKSTTTKATKKVTRNRAVSIKSKKEHARLVRNYEAWRKSKGLTHDGMRNVLAHEKGVYISEETLRKIRKGDEPVDFKSLELVAPAFNVKASKLVCPDPVVKVPRISAEYFSGEKREEQCQSIFKQLQSGSAPIALVGAGGMGKTELAYRIFTQDDTKDRPYFSGGYCLMSGDEEAIGKQLVDFFKTFSEEHEELPKPPRHLRGAAAIVQWMYEHYPYEELKVLLIFDSISEYKVIKKYLPRRHYDVFKVFITTQNDCLSSSFTNIPICQFDLEDSLTLFRKVVDRDGNDNWVERSKESFTTLSFFVGYLPLAIVLLGEHIFSAKGKRSKAKILEELTAELKDDKRLASVLTSISDKTYYADGELKNADLLAQLQSRGLGAVYGIVWKGLSADAQNIAKVISLLAHDAVPLSLIYNCMPSFTEQQINTLVLEELSARSFIDTHSPELFKYHRLTRTFVREIVFSDEDGLGEAWRAAFDGVIKSIKGISLYDFINDDESYLHSNVAIGNHTKYITNELVNNMQLLESCTGEERATSLFMEIRKKSRTLFIGGFFPTKELIVFIRVVKRLYAERKEYYRMLGYFQGVLSDDEIGDLSFLQLFNTTRKASIAAFGDNGWFDLKSLQKFSKAITGRDITKTLPALVNRIAFDKELEQKFMEVNNNRHFSSN